MYSSRLIILLGTFTLVLAQISIGTVSGANVATTPSSTPAPGPAVISPNATSTNGSSSLSTTATATPGGIASSTTPHAHIHGLDDDDCSDEQAEPEPGASGDNRQGKQITLGEDKDKYTHENGTAAAEPEPEKSANENGTTTKAPAVGSASRKEVAITYSVVLGMVFTALFATALCFQTNISMTMT